MAAGRSPHGRYRPDIDGLRAVAILAVLGYHYFPRYFPGGFVGVDIFFVISGFLISGIILDDLAENKFSFLNFYARRVRRLFPALALVLAFSLAAGWLVLFTEEFKALGKHVFGGAAFISNILYWRESGYFDAEAAAKPLLHLWSLGIEEQFYLAFPFFLVWVWKRDFRESLFFILLLAASLAYNRHLQQLDQAAADFYSPATRFWELLAGGVLACLSRAPADSPPHRAARTINSLLVRVLYKKPQAPGSDFCHLLSSLGLIITAVAIFAFRERPDWPGHWAVTPVAGAALVIAAGRNGFFNKRFLANRLAVALGLISYPLYLWHWPILAYLRILNGGLPDRWTRVLAALIALVLAGLTYKLVERPFRFGPRFRTAKTVFLAGLLTVIAGAGVFVYFKGNLSRDSDISLMNLWPWRDKACADYAGYNSFDEIDMTGLGMDVFCRFSNTGTDKTIALIGDSHAWSAFYGLETINSRGPNTLLLASGAGKPNLAGAEEVIRNNEDLKAAYKNLIDKTLYALVHHEDIEAVFIFLHPFNALRHEKYLQSTIDLLTEFGKKVFVVVDWPILPRRGVDYQVRPLAAILDKIIAFRPSYEGELNKSGLIEGRHEYMRVVRSLANAEIIDTAPDVFCPLTTCLVFSDDGHLLYCDRDHLNKAGSLLLAEKVLKPYLGFIE
jgi:peptidoglycan/LPS O-acetylase OafA/YrhL